MYPYRWRIYERSLRKMQEVLYNNLKRICERRKSIRNFTDKKIPKEYIEKILEIAYMSPYASGRKNWELIVIENRDLIQKLADVVEKRANEIKELIRSDFKENYANYAKNFTFFKSAPVLIVPSFRISSSLSLMLDKSNDDILHLEQDNYVKSISCVVMLILLAAESLGLGSCYMTGPLIAEREIVKLIPIKNGRNIGAIIPIGYTNRRIKHGN